MDPEKENLKITLHKLQQVVGEGDIEKIKEIINWFHQNLARNKQFLLELYTSDSQCTTQTDLILSACQNKQADTLYYLLKETDILVHLTDDSFDDTEVNNQKTEAIKSALRKDAFVMVEMLYDFWCGNLHWIGQDINDKKTNIETLGNVLKNARVESLRAGICKLIENFHSLITFNAFQSEIYTKLAELKPSDDTPKNIATMLLKVLRVYDEYSNLEKVRLPDKREGQEMKVFLEDKSSKLYRSFGYMAYEVYFRKLDFNVSLLILENLNVLRKHLKQRFNKTEKYFKGNPNMKIFYDHAAKSYEKIESAIYHFIFRTCEDWRLYLPTKRQIRQFNIYHTGKPNLKMSLDVHKLFIGPVIRFERKSFKKCVKEFKKILRIHVICRDPAEVGTQGQAETKNDMKIVTLLNENYLQTIRYMSDHYSLIKIVNYIEAIENTNDINVLMIERVLHVIGELLKSTDDTYHLSRSTQALLQVAMSVETINHLHNIRNYLSHADKGQLSTRIDIANTQAKIFVEIKQELIVIKQIINPVFNIYKSILDKSVLEKGFCLLQQRLSVLPREASKHLCKIVRLMILEGMQSFTEASQFVWEVWTPAGLSFQLLAEIMSIMDNANKIFTKILSAKIYLNRKVTYILPALIENVKGTLDNIVKNNDKVIAINQLLSNYGLKMCDNPDGDEIFRIRTRAARLMKRNKKIKIDLKLLDEIKHYKNHWSSIKEMLAFCFKECKVFAAITALNEDSQPDAQTVTEVYKILDEMKAICVTYGALLTGTDLTFKQNHFGAIQKLHNDTVSNKVILEDPRIVREKFISSLINRLDLLKETLLYPQRIPLSQHVQRFKLDAKFRITLEMILADIANVLAECRIKLMNKSSKLLRDIDLGNVLDHGNPFLEVIGDAFNSHDLSAELLDKAMTFAEDGEAIEALYELFKGGMDYKTILADDLLKMDIQQKKLYEQFKKSPNWESYAKLAQYNPKSRGAPRS